MFLTGLFIHWKETKRAGKKGNAGKNAAWPPDALEWLVAKENGRAGGTITRSVFAACRASWRAAPPGGARSASRRKVCHRVSSRHRGPTACVHQVVGISWDTANRDKQVLEIENLFAGITSSATSTAFTTRSISFGLSSTTYGFCTGFGLVAG